MFDLPAPVAIVCHDAGAANLIFAWAEREGSHRLRSYAEGPAALLWKRRFREKPLAPSLEAALDGAASVLSGTGWNSDLEHRARIAARERGLPSVAAVDHWVNYRERFERDGKTVLPDGIWVADEYALGRLRALFPNLPVGLRPNHYLEEEAALARGFQPDPRRILYVLEPARSDWGRGRPGEFQALDYFIEHHAALDLEAGAYLRLRPHPSDPERKYDKWLAAHGPLDAALDRSSSLAEAIGRSGWVVGAQSFAMVVALAAGRRVASTLPPWAPPCKLPQRGIVRLSSMV